MNIEQNNNIGICGVTVTFTIAELIVLKGLSENIDCILNPKPDEMRSKTLWSEKHEKLRPCNEKLITLINKITSGIQSLDKASNDLFTTITEVKDIDEKLMVTYSIADLHEMYYDELRKGHNVEGSKIALALEGRGVSPDEILTIYQTNCKR